MTESRSNKNNVRLKKIRKTRPPNPWNLLYKNLFVRRDKTATLEVLSEGLHVFTKNAELLLDDAKLLLDSKKYSRAHFLISTADEEMAKAYIILDACRLRFDAHEHCLKKLSQAFYRHVEKHAYNKIYRSDIRDMPHAKDIFYDELKLWWPSSDIESGEPDMPHVTRFNRDLNLYADFIDYDQNWWIPTDSTKVPIFEWSPEYNPFSTAQNALSKLIYTQNLGLYSPVVLKIINDIFKKHLITEKTTNDQLFKLHDDVAEKVGNLLGISHNKLKKSILIGWPLYHFLQNG